MLAGSCYPQDETAVAQALALAVRAELQDELKYILEMWRLEGLDIARPLTVTDHSRDVGTEIQQVIDTNNNRSIVTRT